MPLPFLAAPSLAPALLALSVLVAPASPQADDARWMELARGAAADLPWGFDATEALERARAEGRPLLVYLRCTDDRDHLASAETTIEAREIRYQEDGYAKDLLFRVGPLSDPDVAGLIERRFVPLCMTYVLSEHNGGVETPAHWGATGGAGVRYLVSATEGHAAPGALVIENDDPDDTAPHNWTQAFEPTPELEGQLVLEASLRAEQLEKGARCGAMIQCWKGQEMLATAHLNEVNKAGDWKRLSTKFRVPDGTESVRVRAYLVGAGRALFDDVAIRPAGGRGEAPNLLSNGGVDQLEGAGAFGMLGISPRRVTTPALVVIDPADGGVVRKLHRFGAIPTELVDRWLRGVLFELGAESGAEEGAAAFLDGDLERALELLDREEGEAARLLRARALLRLGRLPEAESAARSLRGARRGVAEGHVALRGGEWERAAEAFERAVADDVLGEEARFWRAFALLRSGRYDEARAGWTELAGESRFGRKAAACLVRGGPRPFLTEVVRSWPDEGALPEQTELGRPEPIELERTVVALLETQRANGAFGGHTGVDGFGFADPAITALAIEALRANEGDLSRELRPRAEEARERALRFLVEWPDRAPPPGTGLDAFNNPYVLMTLLTDGREAAARRVIERSLASQLENGNWTVYHPGRPASFNTALNVQALMRAREARLEVDKKALERGVEALAVMRQESGLFPYSTADGHEWMTTEHGSIARDPLCELVLLEAGEGSKKTLEASLERYALWAHELRAPTKRLYDYFNARGHGGYYFFFAHWNATQAAGRAGSKTRKRARAIARDEVLCAREGDGSFVDQFLLGRAYGTAMALLILASS